MGNNYFIQLLLAKSDVSYSSDSITEAHLIISDPTQDTYV
jgi:hypothetical protein